MALIDTLVAYWKMDEASGVRYASHGGLHLTDVNTVRSQAGRINLGTLHSDASQEYLKRADTAALDLSGAFSIAFWLKSIGSSGIDRGVICKGSSYSATLGYNVYMAGTGGPFDHKIQFSKGNEYMIGTHQFNDNVWRYVVCRFNGGSIMTIYVNNVLDGYDAAKSAAVGNSANELRIGARSYTLQGGSYLDGGVDEVAIWNREITVAEMTQLWNGGAGLAYPFGVDHVRAIAGVIDLTGVVSHTLIRRRLVGGALDLAGALSKITTYSRPVAGTLELTGSLDRAVSFTRSVAGSIDFSGALTHLRTIPMAVSGVLDFSGDVVRSVAYSRAVAGVLDFAGTLSAFMPPRIQALVKLVVAPLARIRMRVSPEADVEVDESPEGRIRSK